MDTELIFSGNNPVVINYNGDEENIYAPITTSSCDISVVSDRVLDELYTAQKDDYLVYITKYVPTTTITYEFLDNGIMTSELQDIVLNEQVFSIFRAECIYTDCNNVFRFRGVLKDIGGVKHYANLKYNPTNNTWEENDDWNLGEVTDNSNITYTYDGVNSYKIDSNTNLFYIWDGSGWGPSSLYQYVEYENPNVITQRGNAGHLAKDIFQMVDGRYASLNSEFPDGRYAVWEPEHTRWRSVSLYVDPNDIIGGSIHGSTHQKIKNQVGRYIDVIIIGPDVYSITYTGLGSGRFTLERLFGIPDYTANTVNRNFFTDKNDNLCCIAKNGIIFFWSWKAERWMTWVTFQEDNVVSNSFNKVYEVPSIMGESKKVIISYQDTDIVTSDHKGAIILSNLRVPEVKVTEERTGDYYFYNIWEGFMTPNMYSQEVTPNLDTINLNCIDYMSIMKFVTLDNIFLESDIMSYGEIIGSIITFAAKRSTKLIVEDVVSYGGAYNGVNNGLLDMRIQLSNFWDESGKASTAYEVIEELLRPFCLRMFYYSLDEKFIIYNVNNMSEENRYGREYNVNEDGTLHAVTGGEHRLIKNIVFGSNEIKTNNISNTTLDIKDTYDKVTAISSTSVPSYSNMAIDLVNYNDRDMYQVGYMNVQRNKTKGYQKTVRMIPGRTRPLPETVITPVTEDKWYYIWNGVYCNPEYALAPEQVGAEINWHLNINAAYEYLNDYQVQGNPNGTGSILNFYGGSNNPTATGKVQVNEKAVEILKKITVYAADNGIPPEFMELSDLGWTYNYGGSYNGVLVKTSPEMQTYGEDRPMGDSNTIVYHQVYDNITLSSVQDNTVNLSLSTTYSRTGIDIPIDVLHNNTCTDKRWSAGQRLDYAVSFYYPICWDSKNVKVNSTYFKRYATDGEDSSCRPVWDYIRVNMYVVLSDGTYLQFNGKDWVRDGGNHSHPFFLGKMMTGQNLYHTEHRYNVLRSSADSSSFSDVLKYSLSDEDYIFYYDRNYGVTEKETNEFVKCPPLKDQGIAWIADCSEGNLSIKLPYVDDPDAKVVVDIYNSSMLGMTGMDVPAVNTYKSEREPFYYSLNNSGTETTSDFRETTVWVRFIPRCVSYVKAEHLDLNINISVPESNLGQMFPESDIKYTLKAHKNYVESFEMPDFIVNTKNSFVQSSQSYLIFNNAHADPGEFIINGISGRPECYTVQAYFNWLTNIRKYHTKTFKRTNHDYTPCDFSNNLTFVVSPDLGEGNHMVISDSWDVKTDRHSVTTINTDDLQITTVDQVQSEEIPRMARAERYNLPTASPRRVGNGTSRNR